MEHLILLLHSFILFLVSYFFALCLLSLIGCCCFPNLLLYRICHPLAFPYFLFLLLRFTLFSFIPIFCSTHHLSLHLFLLLTLLSFIITFVSSPYTLIIYSYIYVYLHSCQIFLHVFFHPYILIFYSYMYSHSLSLLLFLFLPPIYSYCLCSLNFFSPFLLSSLSHLLLLPLFLLPFELQSSHSYFPPFTFFSFVEHFFSSYSNIYSLSLSFHTFILSPL